MPTYEEQQLESFERLVSFSKHAKLSFRSAHMEAGDQAYRSAFQSCHQLTNVIMTDFIACDAHNSDKADVKPLAESIRAHVEKIGSILDNSLPPGRDGVDKRVAALAVLNKSVQRTVFERELDGIAEEMNVAADFRVQTRSAFNGENVSALLTAAHELRELVNERMKGVSTLYADHSVDNVDAFASRGEVAAEKSRLEATRYSGANASQRELWAMRAASPPASVHASEHSSIESGSDEKVWPAYDYGVDLQSGRSSPSSEGRGPYEGFYGSVYGGQIGYGGRSSSDRDTDDNDFGSQFHDHVSVDSQRTLIDSEFGSASGSEWGGISRPPSRQPSEISIREYVRQWPGPGQGQAMEAYYSEDRQGALLAAQQAYGQFSDNSHSSSVADESRESSPMAASSSIRQPGSPALRQPSADYSQSPRSIPRTRESSPVARSSTRQPEARESHHPSADRSRSPSRIAETRESSPVPGPSTTQQPARQEIRRLSAGRAQSPHSILETPEDLPAAGPSTYRQTEPNQDRKRGRRELSSDGDVSDAGEPSKKRQKMIDSRSRDQSPRGM